MPSENSRRGQSQHHRPHVKRGILRTPASSGRETTPIGVVFADEITIYEFPIQIGDNPAVSTGCPITIGWKLVRKDTRSMEAHEYAKKSERRQRREPTRARRIPPEVRGQILLQAGFSVQAIAQAALAAALVREDRMETLRKQGWDRVAGVLEQTGKLPKGIVRATLGTTGDILSTTGDLVLATGGLMVNTTMVGLGSAGRQISKTFGNAKPKTVQARSA
jgi:hypothetical protein